MNVDRQTIAAGLRSVGLDAGNIVLLHSSLASFGHVDGGADAVVDAFLDVLGESGTLLVPVFGALGIITEVVRNRPDAVCSVHPRAAAAAIGGDAEALCSDHWKAETAHGADTPYMRLYEKNGFICLLGVDQDRSTFLHSIEAMLRLPYLTSTAEFTFDSPEGEVTKSWKFFPGPHRNFIGIEHRLRDAGIIQTTRIGNAVVRLMPARELYDDLVHAGRTAPDLFLCDNPNCNDCIAQRAGLRTHRLAEENFTLTAAASLAGRYIPEIIENCHRAGIQHVELDAIEGRTLAYTPAEQLAATVDELQRGDIAVTGLRLPVVTPDAQCWKADDYPISRISMPLCADAARYAEMAAACGRHLSFYNTEQSSSVAAEIMNDMQAQGHTPGFAFDAAAFARCDEKPFLKSYKTKLRQYTDQLIVEDVTWDGTATALAAGNAETKEMISTLRCVSFAGPVVLGAGNRTVGNLQTAADRFMQLLETM